MADETTVYIITVSDLWGREIKLSDTTWRGHIIADHPEVRGQLRKVETTIKRPEHVIEVAERNLRFTIPPLPPVCFLMLLSMIKHGLYELFT